MASDHGRDALCIISLLMAAAALAAQRAAQGPGRQPACRRATGLPSGGMQGFGKRARRAVVASRGGELSSSALLRYFTTHVPYQDRKSAKLAVEVLGSVELF